MGSFYRGGAEARRRNEVDEDDGEGKQPPSPCETDLCAGVHILGIRRGASARVIMGNSQ
ncbi:MAG: hypothetical protein JWR19_1110 [Pedosphaera sp.]|nr:hypothetical protein [Pedosphaera sp.]